MLHKISNFFLKKSSFNRNNFITFLNFHPPGVAAVSDSSGAYHINRKGNPIYNERFFKTFGFYDGLAAVQSHDGCYHIDISGKQVYTEKYEWCGNFQEGFSPIRNQKGQYFHINKAGKPIYKKHYTYVGDFKDGIAVVCNKDGFSTHINSEGHCLHRKWFHQLDIYHKGFARAKDNNGWFHVDIDGNEIYKYRFNDLEPFYNGIAHATEKDGNIILIDESGGIIKTISNKSNYIQVKLSSDFVSFWTTESIQLAIRLNIFDSLPTTLENISIQTSIPLEKTSRFLRALEEIGVIEQSAGNWQSTKKGSLLYPLNKSHMASAALMWPKVQEQWKTLNNKLKNAQDTYHPTFKEDTNDNKLIKIYQRAIDGYSNLDFQEIGNFVEWHHHKSILALGRTAVSATQHLLEQQKHLMALIINTPCSMNNFNIPKFLQNRLSKMSLNFQEKWPAFSVDAIFLPRFIHYFPDEKAVSVLKKLIQYLSKNGKIYVFEMMLFDEKPDGGLLDINMLAESGGKLRTASQWKKLFKKAGLRVSKIERKMNHLYLIEGTLRDEYE